MSPTRARRSRSAKGATTPAPPPRPFIAHHHVPPHEVLTEAETAKVLADLKTTIDRLPKILASDPGLKTDTAFVKAREVGTPMSGRLVRIRRPSQTAGEAIAYRVLATSAGGD